MSDSVDFGTLAKNGTWTLPSAIASVGQSLSTAISLSEFGFSSANDYAVALVNKGGAANSPFIALSITNKTATGFTLQAWNAHWASGSIGAGTQIEWAVFRTSS